jgi:hypothetical protein
MNWLSIGKQIQELKRQLDSSNSIREAEKKILIKEIEKNWELSCRLKELEVEKEEAYRRGYDEGIKDGLAH